MGSDGRLRVDFISNVPKHRIPEPADDWATVDFDAGPGQIVILGCVRDGDSRHELTLEEVRLEEDEPDARGRLVVELRSLKRDEDMIRGGPESFNYRIAVASEAPLPGRYVIRHFDEDGTKQFEVTELLMADPSEYQQK